MNKQSGSKHDNSLQNMPPAFVYCLRHAVAVAMSERLASTCPLQHMGAVGGGSGGF